mmetsp:Transcript_36409/g.74247  ORF Transcript_36409/g.74247 Transcript_36409/m.74247 type:complete len:1356 (+) Transcript_36409:87-4154(+)
MAKYYLAAALLILLNPPQNSPLGGDGASQLAHHHSSIYCDAFAPPSLFSTINSHHGRRSNDSRLLQVPIRKSGVLIKHNDNNDNENNNDTKDDDASFNKNDITIINSTNGPEKISVINPTQRRNGKMRQEHDGALTWTSRRGDNNKNVDDKNKRGWSNDDEQLAISHYHHHVKHGLLDEESQMDEGEVEDVAELLLEEPPNLVSDGEYDKWREEQKEESVMELSLAEKRARIMANASSSSGVDVAVNAIASEHDEDDDDNGAITVDESNDDNVGMMRIGSGAGSPKGGSDDNDEGTGNVLTLSRPTESVTAIESETEVESLPTDVGVLFVNGVTDDSPIAHAADIRDDEALLNDAEKVLDIINEAEAQLDSVAAVESKEEVELAVASDADEDVVMVKGDAADVEVNDVETPDEGSPSPPIIPPALNSIVDGITSMIMPSPPQTPPTNHNIDYNSELSTEHLSEINAKLEETLNSQKSDLGRLRRKINTLRGELRQANREVNKNVQDQVNAKMAPLREEVVQANEAVAKLEDQVEKLTRQLDEQTVKYEKTLEDKERIAAEYGYVAKSYMELKRSLDTNTNDWQEKLQTLTGDTQSLEERMAQYQEESKRWKKKCIEKANMLDESTAHIKELQSVMDEGMMEIRSKQGNIDDIVAAATKEEKARSKDNLQRLSDEYEVLVSKKSKKIGELRTTLRSANVKRRQVERHARKDKSAALKALRLEMSTEINYLKSSLQEKEDAISKMGASVQGDGVAKEEKEQVFAELMFLSKSFQELESSLETNRQNYEECIQSFEEEAAVKEKLILDLRKELEVAQKKISSLESQVSDLTAELVEERRKNEHLTGAVSSLRSEMDAIRSNADGFENIISILRSEKDAYERQLAEEQDSAQSLKKKKDDLEDLIRKTKDSLVMEKERVTKDMSEKDSRIAKIDQELAKRVKENKTLKKSLKHTTDRYNSEQARVERLNAQLQRARRNLPLTNADHADEIEMITSRINELSESKDDYKSMLSNAESRIKVMTQQLLLSNQHVLKKQSEIARLKEELSAVASTSTDAGTLNDTISALTAELEVLKSSASMQNAVADEKLHLVNLKLEEKEADVVTLQNKIKELVHEKKEADHEKKRVTNNSGAAEISELKSSIETLQTSLKDAQVKAKEKIQLKNQSLKEKENTIEKLKADMIDLQSEKDKISEKLSEQVKRNEDDYLSHELQLKHTEERLVKENLAAMNAMEKEMKDTVYQLEMEVKTLKKKVSDGDRIGSTATLAQAKRMQDLETALRQSKEQKVSLLNENMKMKHRIDNLQFVQAKASKETVSSVPMKVIGEDKQKDVPTYFQEKQRPLVIRVVGNAWKKVFSRKKL